LQWNSDIGAEREFRYWADIRKGERYKAGKVNTVPAKKDFTLEVR
jgi:hypothetical protein